MFYGTVVTIPLNQPSLWHTFDTNNRLKVVLLPINLVDTKKRFDPYHSIFILINFLTPSTQINIGTDPHKENSIHRVIYNLIFTDFPQLTMYSMVFMSGFFLLTGPTLLILKCNAGAPQYLTRSPLRKSFFRKWCDQFVSCVSFLDSGDRSFLASLN
jgi:hypothetical protein